MSKKFTFARVAFLASAAVFGINAVTFASQHPFSLLAYLEAGVAVAVAAVGGFFIGRNQPEVTEPSEGVQK